MGRKSLLGWIIVYKLIVNTFSHGLVKYFFYFFLYIVSFTERYDGTFRTNQLLMHQKSMQITCGRTDEYEHDAWYLLAGMNAHRGYYQQKVCLFGTLMAYCEHFLGERILGETKMLTFIHWSSGIKLPTVCWSILKLSVFSVCSRVSTGTTDFKNF